MISEERQRNLLELEQEIQSLHARNDDNLDWILSREDIHLTNRELGRGGWATVREGRFRGCAVAVKEIYEVIYFGRNQRLFRREMTIASHCRHPCLLQVMY